MMDHTHPVSRGCQLCQQGKWLCIFLTYRCNAGCHFCPAPFRDDRISSSLGNQKEEILSNLIRTDLEGISFSGGDPFLVFDRLLEWLTFFKEHFPDYYYWVYSNGLGVTKGKMRQLSAAGMDEIRFNIAATGYLNENVWNAIKAARDIFSFVSIEIPSIGQDFGLLKNALNKIDRAGVDFLNLHDYILNNAALESEGRRYSSFLLNEVIPLKFESSTVENTERIIDLSIEKGYGFAINHCSMKQKEAQMVQRRLKMGRLFSNPEYDLVLPDGTICNFYSIEANIPPSELQKKFADPDFRTKYSPYLLKLNDPRISADSGSGMITAHYIPQMGTDQGRIYLRTEIRQL